MINKEIVEKNLITILGMIMVALPAILESLAEYVPIEYSSAFGLLIIIVGKIYQANNFDTINKQKEENEEDIKSNGDIESSEKELQIYEPYDINPDLENLDSENKSDLEETDEEI